MNIVLDHLASPRIPLTSLERLARALGCLPTRTQTSDAGWRRVLVANISEHLRAEAWSRRRSTGYMQ